MNLSSQKNIFIYKPLCVWWGNFYQMESIGRIFCKSAIFYQQNKIEEYFFIGNWSKFISLSWPLQTALGYKDIDVKAVHL